MHKGPALEKYREKLIDLQQASQEHFDKSVLSLSGGALGLTFTFLDKVIPFASAHHKTWLYVAWISWAISILLILASLYLSERAMSRAIEAVDKGYIHDGHPGGWVDIYTGYCNAIGGIAFFIGVFLMIRFVAVNLHVLEHVVKLTGK